MRKIQKISERSLYLFVTFLFFFPVVSTANVNLSYPFDENTFAETMGIAPLIIDGNEPRFIKTLNDVKNDSSEVDFSIVTYDWFP